MDAFLEPVLAFLSEQLPPPLFALLLNVLSICTASVRVVASLVFKPPEEWDLQSVLPPLVTILAAYLALASLYRTTTWLFRLTFWFIKWGFIIGTLGLGAGWVTAVTNMSGEANGGLSDLLSTWLSGRATSIPGIGMKERKYRAWDKFGGASDWQYQEGQEGREQNEAQVIMQNIVDTANQVFGGSNWWQLAKAMGGGQSEKRTGESSTKSR